MSADSVPIEEEEQFFCNKCGFFGADGERWGNGLKHAGCDYLAAPALNKQATPEPEQGDAEDENKRLHRVFYAAAQTVFWLGDPQRLKENLAAQREAIIAFNDLSPAEQGDAEDRVTVKTAVQLPTEFAEQLIEGAGDNATALVLRVSVADIRAALSTTKDTETEETQRGSDR